MATYGFRNTSASTISFGATSINAGASFVFYDSTTKLMAGIDDIKASMETLSGLNSWLSNGSLVYALNGVDQASSAFYSFWASFYGYEVVASSEPMNPDNEISFVEGSNMFFASPATGSGAPNFRTIQASDIPDLSASYLRLSGGTMTGRIIAAASVAGASSLRIPNGVVPTTPVTGDVWAVSGVLYYHDGSASTKIITSQSVQGTTNAIAKFTSANAVGNSLLTDNGSQLSYNSAFTVSSAGVLTAGTVPVARVSGLATSATTDTTNATNITSGTLNAARLPTSGVTAGAYGSTAQIPVVTVDATGRITSITTAANPSGSAWSVQPSVFTTLNAAYFSNTVTGDLIHRSAPSTVTVHLGVFDGSGGSNASSLWYTKNSAGTSYVFSSVGIKSLGQMVSAVGAGSDAASGATAVGPTFDYGLSYKGGWMQLSAANDLDFYVGSSDATAWNRVAKFATNLDVTFYGSLTATVFNGSITGSAEQLGGVSAAGWARGSVIGDIDQVYNTHAASSLSTWSNGTNTGTMPIGTTGDSVWWNVVSVRHRNGTSDGLTAYGGQLAWGMTGYQGNLFFRSHTGSNWATWQHVMTYNDHPTTIAGYGISDGLTLTAGDARYPQLSGNYSNPSWIASIDASKITSGVIDPARIPFMPSQAPVVVTTLAGMSVAEQNTVFRGTIVTVADGNRYVYSGAGSKTLAASYVLLADVTPDWAAIANKPTNVSYWNNDAGYATQSYVTTNFQPVGDYLARHWHGYYQTVYGTESTGLMMSTNSFIRRTAGAGGYGYVEIGFGDPTGASPLVAMYIDGAPTEPPVYVSYGLNVAGVITEGGQPLSDRYAAKIHSHDDLIFKDGAIWRNWTGNAANSVNFKMLYAGGTTPNDSNYVFGFAHDGSYAWINSSANVDLNIGGNAVLRLSTTSATLFKNLVGTNAQFTSGMQILAPTTGWGEGIRIVAASGAWGGLRITRANDTVSRTGNWAIGYANNTSGDFELDCVNTAGTQIKWGKFYKDGGLLVNGNGSFTGSVSASGMSVFSADVTLSASSYTQAALEVARVTTGATYFAGIGLHNSGSNAAYLYITNTGLPKFRYRTDLNADVAIWDSNDFSATNVTNWNTSYTHSQASGNPHGTTIAQISGLQTALDSKQASGNYVTLDTTQTITGSKAFSTVIVGTRLSLGQVSSDTVGSSAGIQINNAATSPTSAYVLQHQAATALGFHWYNGTAWSWRASLAPVTEVNGFQFDTGGASIGSLRVDGTYARFGYNSTSQNFNPVTGVWGGFVQGNTGITQMAGTALYFNVGATTMLSMTSATSIALTVRPTFNGATPWDSINLPSPATTSQLAGYLPISRTLGVTDGYSFTFDDTSNAGKLVLNLTDDNDGSEGFIVRTSVGVIGGFYSDRSFDAYVIKENGVSLSTKYQAAGTYLAVAGTYTATNAWTRDLNPGVIGSVDDAGASFASEPNSSWNSPYFTFGGSSTRLIQIAGAYDSALLSFRRKADAVWSSWSQFWHSGNLAFGSTAGTMCQGNDSRLTDARVPVNNTFYVQGTNASRSATQNATALTALRPSGFYSITPTDPINGIATGGGWTHLITQNGADWYTTTPFTFQIAARFSNSLNQAWGAEGYFMRTISNGTENGAWRELWHSGNLAFGTGNANMARGDHNHSGVYQSVGNYVTTDTVQTISGAKTFSTNVVINGSITGSGDLTRNVGSITAVGASTANIKGTDGSSGAGWNSMELSRGMDGTAVNRRLTYGFYYGDKGMMMRVEATTAYANDMTWKLLNGSGASRDRDGWITEAELLRASSSGVVASVALIGTTASFTGQVETGSVFIAKQVQAGDVAGQGARIALLEPTGNAKGWIMQHGSTADKLQFFHQDAGAWVEKASITNTGAMRAASLRVNNYGTSTGLIMNASSTNYAGIFTSGTGAQQTITFGQSNVDGVYQSLSDIAAGSATFSGNVTAPNVIYGQNSTGTNHITNISSLSKSGFYDGQSITDAPVGNWTHVIHNNYINDNGWQFSIAANFAGTVGNGENYYMRVKRDAGFFTTATGNGWRKLWHDGNLGSPASLTSNNVWTGTNTFNNTLQANELQLWCANAGAYRKIVWDHTNSAGIYDMSGNRQGWSVSDLDASGSVFCNWLSASTVSNADIILITNSGSTTLAKLAAGRIRMVTTNVMNIATTVTYGDANVVIIVRAWSGMYSGATEGKLMVVGGDGNYAINGSNGGQYGYRAFVEFWINATTVMWLT